VDGAAAFGCGTVDVRAVETALSYRSSSFRAFSVSQHLVERRQLIGVLEESAWDTDRAASALGIHRATIYRRMKRHGINLPSDIRSEIHVRVG
jgi:transcriptional regulator of acetoin/glycerol metabolism